MAQTQQPMGSSPLANMMQQGQVWRGQGPQPGTGMGLLGGALGNVGAPGSSTGMQTPDFQMTPQQQQQVAQLRARGGRLGAGATGQPMPQMSGAGSMLPASGSPQDLASQLQSQLTGGPGGALKNFGAGGGGALSTLRPPMGAPGQGGAAGKGGPPGA